MEDRDRRQLVRETIARAWNDPAFLAKLLTHPEDTLRDAGFEVRPGVTIRMHQDTEKVEHGVIPPRPPNPDPKKVWQAEDVHILYCFTGRHAFGYVPDPDNMRKK